MSTGNKASWLLCGAAAAAVGGTLLAANWKTLSDDQSNDTNDSNETDSNQRGVGWLSIPNRLCNTFACRPNMERTIEVCQSMKGRSLIAIQNYSKEEVEAVMEVAAKCKICVQRHGAVRILQSKVIGLMFFEPSTRTRCSFETAAKRLGCNVIPFIDPSNTSSVKGESFYDSVRMLSSYCDALVIRHPSKGIMTTASEATSKPFINAGDGGGEHPSQSLLDLFTILSFFPLRDYTDDKYLSVTFVGDLLYGRTVHSLSQLLAMYNVKLNFIAPAGLEFPEDIEKNVSDIYLRYGRNSLNQQLVCHSLSLRNAIPKTDILYMTRIQKERFATKDTEQTTCPEEFCLTKEKLDHASPIMKVLHPLPRNEELNAYLDSNSHAAYFIQAENGLYVRMALLVVLFGKAREMLNY